MEMLVNDDEASVKRQGTGDNRDDAFVLENILRTCKTEEDGARQFIALSCLSGDGFDTQVDVVNEIQVVKPEYTYRGISENDDDSFTSASKSCDTFWGDFHYRWRSWERFH